MSSERAKYKPTIFIASTQANLFVAKSLRKRLQNSARVKIWTEQEFKIGSSSLLEELKSVPHVFDFCICILGEDRKLEVEGLKYLSSENVVFEYGYFSGVSGQERVFIAQPKSQNLKRVVDLEGLIPITYSVCATDASPPAIDWEGLDTLRKQVSEMASSIIEGHRTQVRKGYDAQLERHYVEKKLIDESLAGEFKESVLAAGRISDLPNFATIYQASLSTRPQPYFRRQYFEHGTLLDTINSGLDRKRATNASHAFERKPQRLNPFKARRLIFKIGEAINRVSKEPNVEVNLKPSSIFLDRHGEPYLTARTRLDFASGAEALSWLESGLLEVEDIVYTAPECFDDSYVHQNGRGAADVYRLGILAYHMLIREMPPVFGDLEPSDKNKSAIVKLIVKHGSAAFSELKRIESQEMFIPQNVSETMRRMLLHATNIQSQADGESRFMTIADAIRSLRTLEEEVFVHVRESLERCRSKPSFLERFYERFRDKIGPSRMKELFSGVSNEDQAKKLDSALSETVGFMHRLLRDPEPESNPKFYRRAVQHAKMNITAEEYQAFKKVLVDTICDERQPADPSCNDAGQREAIKKDWESFLQPVIGYFTYVRAHDST